MEDEPETVLSTKAASQVVNESCSDVQVYDYRVTMCCFKGKNRPQTRKKQTEQPKDGKKQKYYGVKKAATWLQNDLGSILVI